MAITLQEAKDLQFGEVLYHRDNRNADGTPQRWKVNGQPKTWKTRPDEVRVPLKNGLRNCDYLTHRDLDLLSFTEEEALFTPPGFPSPIYGDDWAVIADWHAERGNQEASDRCRKRAESAWNAESVIDGILLVAQES